MCACGGTRKRRITQQEQKTSQLSKQLGSTNQQVANYNNAVQKQQSYNQSANTKKIYR